MVAVALILVSCSMSAKPEQNETEKASAQGEVVALNKADFLSKVYNYEKNQTQWVYEGNKPAIIDFYADWCGPCKKVSPILKELAAQYKDDIVIYKINVDNPCKIKETNNIFIKFILVSVKKYPVILNISSETFKFKNLYKINAYITT